MQCKCLCWYRFLSSADDVEQVQATFLNMYTLDQVRNTEFISHSLCACLFVCLSV